MKLSLACGLLVLPRPESLEEPLSVAAVVCGGGGA